MAGEKSARRLIKSIPFTNPDGSYEIMAFMTESGYEVRAKKDGQSLPWVYSMEYTTAYDLEHDRHIDACDVLIDSILSAILNKTHEPK